LLSENVLVIQVISIMINHF